MRNSLKIVFMGLILFSWHVEAQDSANSVVKRPLVISARIEMGQVAKGDSTMGVATESQFLSQSGISMMQEVLVGQRLDIKVGAGGTLYYSIPFALGAPSGNGAKFSPGIAQAQAVYKLGDVVNPWGTLRLGYFPYKYNSDARNLGEYLFRGGAYPTYISTGGLAITDNALAKLFGLGASFSSFNGMWKNNFLLTSETSNIPTGDITPSYVTEANIGPFQFGGGISFYHYLPVNRPSVESPKQPKNVYYEFNNLPAGIVIKNAANPNDSIIVKAGQQYISNGDDLNAIANAYTGGKVDSLISTYHPSSGSYTFKAIRTMARVSFNVQKLFRMTMLNPEDLKIYSEIAVLGWKDYPGVYRDRWNRTPIMMGLNLPTFKFVDVFSFEGEFLNTPNPDDFWQMEYLGQPDYGGSVTGKAQDGDYSVLFPKSSKASWKWSAYVSKKLMTGVSVVAQVASDHIRLPYTSFTGTWTGGPMTTKPSDWYYIVAINFGI